jgi:hypothetical protein
LIQTISNPPQERERKVEVAKQQQEEKQKLFARKEEVAAEIEREKSMVATAKRQVGMTIIVLNVVLKTMGFCCCCFRWKLIWLQCRCNTFLKLMI